MSTSLFSTTPTVTVTDNRGLIVRNNAYCRHPDSPDVTATRITHHQYDARGYLTQSADPRLNDAGRANFIYITDLTGSVLRTQGVDNGTSVVLNDAAGRSVIAVSSIRTADDGIDDNSQAVARLWQYEDALLPGRPLCIMEKTPDGVSRITERFIYAGNTDAEKSLNLAGQCVSHYDTAGLVQTDTISLTGVPLSVTRRLLKDADNPDTVVDWQGTDVSSWNNLLDPEIFTTLTTLDATGSVLTSIDAKGNLQRIAYDVAGLLSGSWLALNGGTEQVIVKSLTYSAAGQKLREEHGNGVVTTYTYEAQTQRLVHWDNGKPDGLENDQLRYSYDNLTHSNQLELDGSGSVISMEEYYPYGGTSIWTARSQAEADTKIVRYSGKERDATGLYYYGYRYYQPWAGRWLSADPAGSVDGLNLFRMVRNNPETLRDDNGLAPTNDDEEEKNIAEIKKLTIADPLSDSSDTEDDSEPAPKKELEELGFPDELKITLGELTLETLPVGTILYKSMRYKSFDVELAIAGQQNEKEWEGQYFALDAEISEGYELDYLDEQTGHGTAWLHTFEVTNEIPILQNLAEAHGSDKFSGNKKAAAIKDFLISEADVLGDEKTKQINPEKPLMPTLSSINIAFNAPHDTDGGREIIIGGELLRNIKDIQSEAHQYRSWARR